MCAAMSDACEAMRQRKPAENVDCCGSRKKKKRFLIRVILSLDKRWEKKERACSFRSTLLSAKGSHKLADLSWERNVVKTFSKDTSKQYPSGCCAHVNQYKADWAQSVHDIVYKSLLHVKSMQKCIAKAKIVRGSCFFYDGMKMFVCLAGGTIVSFISIINDISTPKVTVWGSTTAREMTLNLTGWLGSDHLSSKKRKWKRG